MTKKPATAAQRQFNQHPHQLLKDKAIELAKYIADKRESKKYSSWDQSLVAEQVAKADAMLRKFNPGHKDNPWQEPVANFDGDAPNSGLQTLNTFGDDCRGLKEGWAGVKGSKYE